MQKTPLLGKPKRYLAQIGERFPDCWKLVDKFRAANQSLSPSYCFLPDGLCRAILHTFNDKYNLHDLYYFSALAAWRATQGVYRFDDDLYSELVEMEIGPLPADVLKRLPEWCVYIELKEESLEGVFAQVVSNSSTGFDELRLLLVSKEEDHIDRLYSTVIILTGSLFDGIMKYRETVIAPLQAKLGRFDNPDWKKITQKMGRIVSLILYICSTNADLSGTPVLPLPVKTKRGLRWFPPASPTIWEVGYRDGPALVRSLHLASKSDQSSGRTARPHVRRAHWHHYWTGSQEKRELILKWLPPILVNVETADELTPTVRPVKT